MNYLAFSTSPILLGFSRNQDFYTQPVTDEIIPGSAKGGGSRGTRPSVLWWVGRSVCLSNYLWPKGCPSLIYSKETEKLAVQSDKQKDLIRKAGQGQAWTKEASTR